MRQDKFTRTFRSARRGFSFVELMVVIGIIAVLMALLMPAFTKARDAAKLVVCASNLKEMGVAMTAYRMEHEFYPGHCGWSQAGTAVAIWPVRLRPYMSKNRTMFYCPARDQSFLWSLTIGPPGGPYAMGADTGLGYQSGELMLNVATFPSTYGYNDWGTTGAFDASDHKQKGLGGDIGNQDPANPGHVFSEIRATAVVDPAEMIAIADNTPDGSWDYNIDPTNSDEYPGNAHSNGCNVLFADGHVDWYLQQALVEYIGPGNSQLNPNWNTINPMWNNDHKFW